MLQSLIQKTVILLLLLATGYLGTKVGVAAYERYQVQVEINRAKAQAGELQKSNKELKRLIAQLGNKEFLMLRVKEELNVKEFGEKVAIVKKDPEPEITQDTIIPTRNTGYLLQWWEVFFKP